MSLHHSRIDYDLGELSEETLAETPFKQLESWIAAAEAAAVPEPHAMLLATCDQHGFPSGRVVLLRGIDDAGLTFYTNRASGKAQALAVNPRASCTFFWPALERQVRVLGVAEIISDEASDAYFSSRPRASQLGAWASQQSSRLTGRAELEASMTAAELRFRYVPVTRPPHWGGYLLRPSHFEFWQGRRNRLHDRLVYELKDGAYERYRLAP